MRKAKLHHYWIALKSPILYIILSCAVLFSFITIYALRANNLKMLELKQAVIVADQENGDIESALQNLRNFVNGHMNTQLRNKDATEPPIQLINQFNRYITAEQQKIQNQDTNKVYRDAQAECENGSIPLTARAQCIQEYVLSRGGNINEFTMPAKELYTFDFASPKWSPDFAGISLVLAIIFWILLIIRLLLGRIMKYVI